MTLVPHPHHCRKLDQSLDHTASSSCPHLTPRHSDTYIALSRCAPPYFMIFASCSRRRPYTIFLASTPLISSRIPTIITNRYNISSIIDLQLLNPSRTDLTRPACADRPRLGLDSNHQRCCCSAVLQVKGAPLLQHRPSHEQNILLVAICIAIILEIAFGHPYQRSRARTAQRHETLAIDLNTLDERRSRKTHEDVLADFVCDTHSSRKDGMILARNKTPIVEDPT